MLCKDPDRQAFSLHFVCECLKSDQVLLKNLGPNPLKSEWPHQTDWWMHLIKTPFPCQTRLWCQYCVNGLFGLLPHQFLPRKSFLQSPKSKDTKWTLHSWKMAKKCLRRSQPFKKVIVLTGRGHVERRIQITILCFFRNETISGWLSSTVKTQSFYNGFLESSDEHCKWLYPNSFGTSVTNTASKF